MIDAECSTCGHHGPHLVQQDSGTEAEVICCACFHAFTVQLC